MAKSKKDISKALRVRYLVFTKEQGIEPKIDNDRLDGSATHVIAKQNGKIIGTMRIRVYNNRARLERLAVLKDYRGKGIGKVVTEYAVSHCKKNGLKEITLHSQFYLMDFYKSLGFTPKGRKFIEAGIEHIEMNLKLKTSNTSKK